MISLKIIKIICLRFIGLYMMHFICGHGTYYLLVHIKDICLK